MPTRKYEQRLRAESADQTRRCILDALYERLRAAPSESVSVDHLAQMAGVARATVYVTFGSRAGLFCAPGADLLERGGFADLLRAAAHPDARESLREGIRQVVSMYAADREVRRALYSMSQLGTPKPSAERSNRWSRAAPRAWRIWLAASQNKAYSARR